MRILVTGGAGFIGSHLCERLVTEGHQVAILDTLISKDPYCAHGCSFFHGDICHQRYVQEVFDIFRPSHVVHLAGLPGVRPSLEYPSTYMRTNIEGSVNVLQTCRSKAIQRVVLASSSAVYGNIRRPFVETRRCAPVSPYGVSKLAMEQLASVYQDLHGLSIVCLRFFTVYGPRQRPDLAIRTFMHRILHDKPLTLFGDGSSIRDYTYVSDTVDGILAALNATSCPRVINIGSGSPVSLQKMVESLEEVLGKKAIIRYEKKHQEDMDATEADIRRAQRVLQYVPQVDFMTGLRSMAAWYHEHGA